MCAAVAAVLYLGGGVAYTYRSPVTVRRVTPSAGMRHGGTRVTLYGSGFAGGPRQVFPAPVGVFAGRPAPLFYGGLTPLSGPPVTYDVLVGVGGTGFPGRYRRESNPQLSCERRTGTIKSGRLDH